MNELRIPKHPVPVRIRAGGTTHRVSLFLGEAAATHAGPQRLVDLLGEPGDFLPAGEEDGPISFFRRDAISVVECDREVPDDPALDSPHARRVAVKVLLADGTGLAGIVRFVLPPERSRLVDFLDLAPTFFRIELERGVAYVNKRHVVRVTTGEG